MQERIPFHGVRKMNWGKEVLTLKFHKFKFMGLCGAKVLHHLTLDEVSCSSKTIFFFFFKEKLFHR